MASLCVLCAFAVVPSAFASTTWTGPIWSVSTAIPDNDDIGFTNTKSVSLPGQTEITGITVTLTFTDGWNGDLYAYLVNGDGFSVLLNRPGRTNANPEGSGTVGMDITFDDGASSDIHTAIPLSGGSVNGIDQPDGPTEDPLQVTDLSTRCAFLSSFTGLDPSGNWNLFVADQSMGDQSVLQSWSLTIAAVPESSAALLGGLGMLLLLCRRR